MNTLKEAEAQFARFVKEASKAGGGQRFAKWSANRIMAMLADPRRMAEVIEKPIAEQDAATEAGFSAKESLIHAALVRPLIAQAKKAAKVSAAQPASPVRLSLTAKKPSGPTTAHFRNPAFKAAFERAKETGATILAATYFAKQVAMRAPETAGKQTQDPALAAAVKEGVTTFQTAKAQGFSDTEAHWLAQAMGQLAAAEATAPGASDGSYLRRVQEKYSQQPPRDTIPQGSESAAYQRAVERLASGSGAMEENLSTQTKDLIRSGGGFHMF